MMIDTSNTGATRLKYHVPAHLHADLSLPAVQRSAALPWVPSPLAGVDRKFLEREGAEVARATSIVRYAAGSAFSAHVHELGEEYLVLRGVFSDASGDHGVGCYVRNPPGSAHAPFTKQGCEIFVKLRQMPLAETEHWVVHEKDQSWQVQSSAGLSRALLYGADQAEWVALEQLEAHCHCHDRPAHRGEEILILSGVLFCANTEHRSGDWLRFPPGQAVDLSTASTACRYWIKRDHLAPR